MDDVKTRLKEITDQCIASYDAWQNKTSDDPLRETLQEHIHELRKVASRLEIEIAMSERDRMASKRIPIPPHRSSKRGGNDHKNHNSANDATDGQPEVKKVLKRGGRKPKAANTEN